MAPATAVAPASTAAPAAAPAAAMPNFYGIAFHLALHGRCIGRSWRSLSGEAEKSPKGNHNRKHECLHEFVSFCHTPFLGQIIIGWRIGAIQRETQSVTDPWPGPRDLFRTERAARNDLTPAIPAP